MAEQSITERAKPGKKPKPPGHVKVYKTAVFKIHNPSQRKRAMLKDSMKRAHLAYTRFLDSLRPDFERFAEMSKKERGSEMQQRAYKFLGPLPLGTAAKAAVRMDAAGAVNSYLELRNSQEGAQPPMPARLNVEAPRYHEALGELVTLGGDIEEENRLRDEIAREARPARLRPVSYYGNDRNFYHLLWDEKADRFYIWLNLHPTSSRHAEPVEVKDKINVRTGALISFRSKTGALFPVEHGFAFQELEFIGRGRPQSAKLVHRAERNGQPCDDFEVHITFEWQTPERPTKVWLGVDRGVYNLAAYSVVDDTGAVIEQGAITGRELRHVQRQEMQRMRTAQKRGKLSKGWSKRRAWADEAVHVTANRLVDLALKHDAQVVLEELKNLSAIRRRKRVPGTRRSGFNTLLNRVQYEKLKNVLIYKLGEHGLPKPVEVHAAGTSITCPECGAMARESRPKKQADDGFDMAAFRCVACGHEADADENAARIIALKGKWFRSLPKKSDRPSGSLPDTLKFERFLRDCAEKRMGVQRS